MTADEALGALVGTLEQLRQIFPEDKSTWDGRPIVRLAVGRLWITAGNLAEICRIERGVTAGVEPWSELVGVFDWDLAGPTNPLMELAFIAWNCVPLWRDVGDEVSVEQINRICSAYGNIPPTQLVDAVPRRIQTMLEWIPRGAAAGDAGLHRLMNQGEPARSQATLDEPVPRLKRIRSRL